MDYNKIKIVMLDCDGVFTDGIIIYDNSDNECKNFSAKDGMGIKLLKLSGIKVALITGRKSNVVLRRCQDLKFDYVYQGIVNKLKIAQEIIDKENLNWENVAYMGDDWNDYPVIKKAILSAAPADAFQDFKNKVDYVCKRKGGRGAIREFVNYLLKKQGKYAKVIHEFIHYLENYTG